MSARESAKRSGIFGFAICGMATGELDEEFKDCLTAVCGELPQDAPKLMQGALNPASILEAIHCGVDLFDASYATVVSLSASLKHPNINKDCAVDICCTHRVTLHACTAE